MWFIKNAGGDVIYLKPNKSMIVSRKEGHDILLKDDASISKIHATVTVRPKVNFKNNEPSSTVYVQDSGSKYGTYLIDRNNKSHKLTKGDHLLTETDRVKFGLQHNIFTLHYVPFILSTSTLKSSEKVELQNIIDTVDGVIIEKWEEYCTHLTVSNVTLTTQVVQALAFGTPIVSLRYWRAVLRCIETNQELPDVEDFVPSIDEGTINSDVVSLKKVPERKVLFKNSAFVCFSQSQYALKDIIKCAGGNLVLFKEGKYTVNQLCSKKVVVLQPSTDSSEPSQASVASYDLIQQALQEKERRLVPESEIFLAILYCSVEKYCNPTFNFKRLIGFSDRNEKKDPLSCTVLAPDTDDVLPTTQRVPRGIIQESLTSSEQVEEQESSNAKRTKLSLRKKQKAENLEDSTQVAIGNRKILDRSALGSEESSREGALMIDETRSSVESDSNDASRRPDFGNDFEESVNKLKMSTGQSTTRRFNLQSKLQTTIVPKKEKVDSCERPTQNPAKNDNPSTSKDTWWNKGHNFESVTENEENLSRKRAKNISDEKSRAKRPQEAVPQSKKSDITMAKSSKRNRADEEDMFSFANEGAAKRKKNARQNDGSALFVLLEDPNDANSDQEENMFEKELQQNKINKISMKRRRSSLSSNDSYIEEEQPQIKIERPESEDELDAALIHCKKEEDTSMNEMCKSTIMSLVRPDIDLTLDSTAGNMKTFVKVYTAIPKQRIKLRDMYVWKFEDESMKSEKRDEELTSSTDEDENDFRLQSKKASKKIRGRT